MQEDHSVGQMQALVDGPSVQLMVNGDRCSQGSNKIIKMKSFVFITVGYGHSMSLEPYCE